MDIANQVNGKEGEEEKEGGGERNELEVRGVGVRMTSEVCLQVECNA